MTTILLGIWLRLLRFKKARMSEIFAQQNIVCKLDEGRLTPKKTQVETPENRKVFFPNLTDGSNKRNERPNTDFTYPKTNVDAPEFDDEAPSNPKTNVDAPEFDDEAPSNPKTNVDAPEFDDEAPSNPKKGTYIKIFKTAVIIFDIGVWLYIIWKRFR